VNEEASVLDQADALMQRHRRYVAAPPEFHAPVVAPAPVEPASTPEPEPAQETHAPRADETDIPVLTDIVADATDVPATHAEHVGAVLDHWLAGSLPAAIEHAADRLLTELAARARDELLPQLIETLNHHGTRQKL